MTDIGKKNPVAETCTAFNNMAARWSLIDDLLGGTLSMRKAGEKWLPREPKEDDVSYNARLDRSILFEGYKDAVDDISSRPFSKPVTIQGTLPENLQPIFDNPDGQGTDITQFAKGLFDAALNRGITHVLVDYPKTEASEGRIPTIADENKAGYRPVFVHIKADQLIGWHYEIVNGKIALTMIRWTETKTIPDGSYGEKVVNTIRVYTKSTWELWTENDKGEYVLTESGVHTFPDGIPLVTCYINKTGFMTATPPMEGLAWQNLAHWQSFSDQKNLLRFARFPLLFFKGITETEMDKDVVIGPGRKWSSTNENADCKYVEHTGSAITSGREDLKDIEDRMTALGLEPLLSRSGGQTATGQSIDEAKNQSSVQAWIRSVELCLYNSFQYAAVWMKTELPEDFKLDIYNDFGVSIRATADIDSLIKLRQAGDIDRETLLRETKRRALLSEMTDVQDVIDAVESEGPSLGNIGLDNGEESNNE